jgi:ketosteroid isomerase-like protein
MKRMMSVALLCLLASLGMAQKPKQKTVLETMVETERAFAKMSEDQGTRPAFMAFIADDGILFRPRAVKGKQWMSEHPLPQSDKRPLLSWYPSVADISLAGDMGYSTGPWEFKSDIHDTAPVAWGTFLTIWKRQRDGSWKFAIDLGISNPKPEQVAAPWQAKDLFDMNGFGPKIDIKAATAALLARDAQFSMASKTLGAQKAFTDYALAEVRVYRNGKFPVSGQQSAAVIVPEGSSVWTWVPTAADVSTTNDLGYTYGTYQLISGEKVQESGNYMRIWKKDRGAWKVLFDLTNPVPPEENKN